MGVRYSELPKTTAPTSDDYVAILDNTSSTVQTTTLQNAVNSTLGTADISKLGDGTVKGAIVAAASLGGSATPMTQAAYNALPATKLTDNVPRYIYDAADVIPASGIDFTPILIDTREGIAANTKPNQIAGALAVKSLNDSLSASVQTKYDDTTGKPMWKDSGADTWNFFSSDITQYDLITSGDPNGNYTYTCSKDYKLIVMCGYYKGTYASHYGYCRPSEQTSAIASKNLINASSGDTGLFVYADLKQGEVVHYGRANGGGSGSFIMCGLY